MIKLNKLIKALENKGVTKWLIREVKSTSYEQFYVLQKLETVRKVDTVESFVTIYNEFQENGKRLLGNYSFIINHNISLKQLNDLIDEAIYSSKFVKNEYYELVKSDKKRSYKEKNKPENPFSLLQTVANIYISSSNDKCMFNSLELFYNENEIHLINSEGVNYKKDIYELVIEAIPSYKHNRVKTELYRMYKYDNINLDKIKEDSKNAVEEVLMRAQATQNTYHGKMNVIIKDENLQEMIKELISTLTYNNVYSKSNFKEIGENLQDNPKDELNINLIPARKADFFDSDGVLLKETVLVSSGKIIDYFGNNRFAFYLNRKPNGVPRKLKVKAGKTKISDIKSKPYIEILEMSGIQLNLLAGYIGGEVRLGKYFDGQKIYPISGFSFSGNLQQCINSLVLSKEVTDINGYIGPKYALLENFDII